MGLLGQGWDDPKSSAIMALAGGLLQGNFGGGLLGANQAFAQAKEAGMLDQLRNAQLQETLAQAQERQIRASREQQEMERQAAIRQALPGLYGAGAPGQVGPFNIMEALRLGMDPKTIQEHANLPNAGRQKVARTVKGMGPDGREYEYQVDEFGQRVGDGLAQYRAPISVNQGNRTTFADPYSLAPVGQFQTFQSPDSAASTAVAIRGQNMVDSRAREANERARQSDALGRVPAGYRVSADGKGLEFIPGGPADPNAAKRAAPTEFQGKAAMFGNRAAEADRILSDMTGKYSPAAVNTKLAFDNTPWYLGGGVTGSIANSALPASAQKAEQAQRDFINAVLRLESGATIDKDEFDNARKQYFPQPGDSRGVIEQKAANRKRAIQGLMDNARATSPTPHAAPPGASTVAGDLGNDPLGIRK